MLTYFEITYDKSIVTVTHYRFNHILSQEQEFSKGRVSRHEMIEYIKSTIEQVDYIVFDPSNDVLVNYSRDILDLVDRTNQKITIDDETKLMVIDMTETQNMYTSEEILV